MKTLADIFDEAADLIEPEGRWTQGDYAKAADGFSVSPRSDDAVCWCLLGAIRRAGGYHTDLDASPALEVLDVTFKRRPRFIPDWNDAKCRSQPQVVAKLREAAAKAREQGL